MNAQKQDAHNKEYLAMRAQHEAYLEERHNVDAMIQELRDQGKKLEVSTASTFNNFFRRKSGF